MTWSAVPTVASVVVGARRLPTTRATTMRSGVDRSSTTSASTRSCVSRDFSPACRGSRSFASARAFGGRSPASTRPLSHVSAIGTSNASWRMHPSCAIGGRSRRRSRTRERRSRSRTASVRWLRCCGRSSQRDAAGAAPRERCPTWPRPRPESTALSKELLRRGFRFVGPTTCYAAMQSLGLVNDHLARCHVRKDCEAERAASTIPVPVSRHP